MNVEGIEGPAAIKMFVAILKTEQDPDIKRTIIHALGDTEGDDAVPSLGGTGRDHPKKELIVQNVFSSSCVFDIHLRRRTR